MANRKPGQDAAGRNGALDRLLCESNEKRRQIAALKEYSNEERGDETQAGCTEDDGCNQPRAAN